MKIWSIITLFVFLNSTALPSLAAVLDWEIPATNVVIQEEESHSSSFSIFEKTIPETLNVHDFIKFFESAFQQNLHFATNASLYLNPHLSIFSPPPEV